MNILIALVSVILLILGTISMVTPLPGGILFIAGGLTGLICSSSRARYCVQWIRTRVTWFNKTVFWLQEKMGGRIKVIDKALTLTRPEPENRGNDVISRQDISNKYRDD